MDKTLEDLGEFAVLKQVVFPTIGDASGPADLGDDCGVLPLPYDARNLVVTTDVAPLPLVFHLGHQSYKTYGWYAVTVNISDLAAGGAEPLAFSTSVEAPPTMLIEDFREFFQGVTDACKLYGAWISGGNIRGAPRFECHGTAIGITRHTEAFSRKSLGSGDTIISIGNSGLFMSSALKVSTGLCTIDALSKRQSESLFRPVARIYESRILAELGMVTGAADNSDGLLMSLYLMSERSNVDIEIDMDNIDLDPSVIEVANLLKCNPWNLVMSWGDYQLVVAVKESAVDTVRSKLDAIGSPYVVLGRVHDGTGKVWGKTSHNRKLFRRLGNENFSKSSYNEVPIADLLKGIAYGDLYI